MKPWRWLITLHRLGQTAVYMFIIILIHMFSFTGPPHSNSDVNKLYANLTVEAWWWLIILHLLGQEVVTTFIVIKLIFLKHHIRLNPAMTHSHIVMLIEPWWW